MEKGSEEQAELLRVRCRLTRGWLEQTSTPPDGPPGFQVKNQFSLSQSAMFFLIN